MGGHRTIGRPKLRWSDVIQKDMKEVETDRITGTENMEKEKTRCDDPK